MTIDLLDRFLPIELTDMIYKHIHREKMREITEILKYKIVFVLVEGRLSFLVCEGQRYENYYSVLEYEEQDISKK